MSERTMLRSDLRNAVQRVLKAARAVEEAVSAEDWDRAETSNATLYKELQPLDRLLTEADSRPSPGELRRIIDCLADISVRHERAASFLLRAREETAEELRQLRSGRRGAASYVQTTDT